MESCDIYIKSFRYNDSAWLDNPDALLELVFNNFSEIPSFYFVSLSLNMSQVFNTNLKQSNYDAILLYVKGVKFRQDEFIPLKNIEDLITLIKTQLDYIEGLNFGKIEIRSSKLYSDKELGIMED